MCLIGRNLWAFCPHIFSIRFIGSNLAGHTVCKAAEPGCDYTSPEAAVNDPVRVVAGDTIDITTDTYVLSTTLLVDRSMTILANDSVFDADGRRAIDVTGSGTNLSLTNVTIINGLADASGGGAMLVSLGASVTVINGTFEDNRADFGGAVYNEGSTLTIRESVFTGNRATAGNGGAVLTDGGGSTTLQRTEIDGNQASVAGGGAAVADNNSQLSFIASTVSNNVAVAAALDQFNDTSTTTSTSCGNGQVGIQGQTFLPTTGVLTAFEFEVKLGGSPPAPGTLLQGRVRIGGQNGAVIATATSVWPTGLPAFSRFFLHYELDKPVIVTPGVTHAVEIDTTGGISFSINTTVDNSNPYPEGLVYASCDGVGGDNPSYDYDFRILGGAPGDGGGIYASSAGFAGLFNTTVSGNIGDGATAGPDSNAIVSTLFSTITNNSGNGLTAKNGDSDGLVFITASIVAGNGVYDCDGGTTTSGYNLIGDITGCVVTPTTGDLVGTLVAPIDPLLGPLQDNGGWTPTHAIDPTSPAFESAGLAGNLPCSDAATDQRDKIRPNGPACDIGAFEFAPPIGPLQTMINAAASGATIIVDPGTYSESITIGSGKTLRGSGPGVTVIDVTGLNVSAITATGDFTLEGIRVTGGNEAGNGGGISASVSGTDIILSNARFDNNNAGDSGGAIYLFEGTLTANDITFSNNTAVEEGGAIYARLSDVVVVNSLFDSNSGGNGGAIMLIAGTSSISDSEFSLNQATGSDGPAMGGAIYNAADLSITDTTIDQSASEIGGGIFNSGTGGILSVVRSTLSNNTANNPGATAGGAIAGAGTMTIFNSTVSGNTAIDGNGGGIAITAGTARLNNVTVAYNAAPLGQRGGLYAETAALISLSNSLRWGNSNSGNVVSSCTEIHSLGYNLSQLDGCLDQPTDITQTNALINGLAANGGLTETHALQSLSPARNTGHPVPKFSVFDASSFALLQTQGAATLDAGTLLLASGPSTVGSAFVPNPIDPTTDFSATFEFRIDSGINGAADGFTFTVSDDPTVLGGSGGFLGIAELYRDQIEQIDIPRGVVNGVSVEFDTWVNGQAEGANDPGAVDHIGIDFNGNLSSEVFTILNPPGSHGILSDGSVWTAWIDYNAADNLLEVRASNNGIRPASPTVSAGVDLVALTGPQAYVGFTGATGSTGIDGKPRILSFLFANSCETTDQRGDPRPKGEVCDIGAFEAPAIPPVLSQVTFQSRTTSADEDDSISYPGVVDIPIIDIPIEKLTGDTFNSPSSAPLGSFPLGSFPIGSFDLRTSPLGSFPLGSFPIGSFPIGSFPLGSFPLSSIPLLTAGGWTEILNDIPKLAGAPLQTVTLEQLLRLSSPGDAVSSIELKDLAIDGSPLARLSIPFAPL